MAFGLKVVFLFDFFFNNFLHLFQFFEAQVLAFCKKRGEREVRIAEIVLKKITKKSLPVRFFGN